MTDDVLLVEVAPEHLPVLFEQQLDPEATRMAAFPSRDRDAFMAHWAKILGNPSGLVRAILFRGRVAGNIVAFELGGQTLVGYWLGREFWGQGIATRALAAFLLLVTKRPLHAHVAKHNLGSIRVLEKCGFTVEREERVAGEEIDELVMVLSPPTALPRSEP
ncbi:MAG TPA: GNAT family N-acetyltransferase [Thermoanaerobaculia bacterium]|jgi:RimJ/RimL family protein N-acetyltransferase|nr:GNAT family N-acetyltransferase [Thermoanaerobaculia bacterium]